MMSKTGTGYSFSYGICLGYIFHLAGCEWFDVYDIWSCLSRSLLAVRYQYGMLDDGTRFHVISHLIRETVSCCKSLLATSIMSRDDSSDLGGMPPDVGAVHSLIQKDRVLIAVSLMFY